MILSNLLHAEASRFLKPSSRVEDSDWELPEESEELFPDDCIRGIPLGSIQTVRSLRQQTEEREEVAFQDASLPLAKVWINLLTDRCDTPGRFSEVLSFTSVGTNRRDSGHGFR